VVAEANYLSTVEVFNDETIQMVEAIRANGGAFPDPSFATNLNAALTL